MRPTPAGAILKHQILPSARSHPFDSIVPSARSHPFDPIDSIANTPLSCRVHEQCRLSKTRRDGRRAQIGRILRHQRRHPLHRRATPRPSHPLIRYTTSLTATAEEGESTDSWRVRNGPRSNLTVTPPVTPNGHPNGHPKCESNTMTFTVNQFEPPLQVEPWPLSC